MNFSPSKLLSPGLLSALATLLVVPAVGYDIPAFHKAPFDRDGIFLQDGERQSLLEALAAVSSNFNSVSSIDEDVVEKALAIALAIDPFHGNSRKAHEALSAGEKPAPTNFYDSRSAAAEALWGIASDLASPPVEPEGGRLAPLVMEIALLVHPSTDSDRILKFASLSQEIDAAWAGFVRLQPELNDSNLRARSFRREAQDIRQEGASNNAPSERLVAESRPESSKELRPGDESTRAPMKLEEIPPVTTEQRSISGVFPAGDRFVSGVFQLRIRAVSGMPEAERFPFLLDRSAEQYPFLPIIAPEGSSVPVIRSPIVTERAREFGISWQQGAIGETDFVLGEGTGAPPSEPIRVSLPLLLCLQAISQSRSLNPEIGIIGAYDRNEKLIQKLQQPAAMIEAGSEIGVPYLLVPETAFPGLVSSLIRSEELESLFHSELLSFNSLETAFDLVTLVEIPDAVKEASEIFAEIEMVSTRMPLPELARNDKVQERLEEILTLVPNHFSARAMLEFGRTPINEDAQLREAIRGIDAVIEPFFILRREYRADTEALYGRIEAAEEALFRLRSTVLPAARDYYDHAADMLEAADAYLSLSNKETSIAQQRIEEVQRLLSEMNAVKINLGMPVKQRPPRF